MTEQPHTAVSPWFSTHFGREVSWSKNWVFPSDLLWFNRWQNLIASKPAFIEILSWNDYGESHYVGPLSGKHTDDGSSKWVNDMPHGAWLDMAKPFITAYKNGVTQVRDYVLKDQLIYWYRPTLKSLNCDATDNTAGGRPEGWEQMSDSVFVVALLTAPGTVTVQSGSKTVSFDAPIGATAFQVPMGVGAQRFTLTRRSTTVLTGRSLRDVSSVCPCGLYNFNAYVGMLPDTSSSSSPDALGADGLVSLTKGLKVTTCQAKPSLGTAYNNAVLAVTAPMATSTPASPTTTSKLATTTAPKTTTAAAAATSSTGGAYCVAGTNAPGTSGNLIGLCQYACSHNYCPPGPCVCTQRSASAPREDPSLGVGGCVQPGLDGSYSGLCSYSCNRGYCPSGACYRC